MHSFNILGLDVFVDKNNLMQSLKNKNFTSILNSNLKDILKTLSTDDLKELVIDSTTQNLSILSMSYHDIIYTIIEHRIDDLIQIVKYNRDFTFIKNFTNEDFLIKMDQSIDSVDLVIKIYEHHPHMLFKLKNSHNLSRLIVNRFKELENRTDINLPDLIRYTLNLNTMTYKYFRDKIYSSYFSTTIIPMLFSIYCKQGKYGTASMYRMYKLDKVDYYSHESIHNDIKPGDLKHLIKSSIRLSDDFIMYIIRNSCDSIISKQINAIKDKDLKAKLILEKIEQELK